MSYIDDIISYIAEIWDNIIYNSDIISYIVDICNNCGIIWKRVLAGGASVSATTNEITPQ